MEEETTQSAEVPLVAEPTLPADLDKIIEDHHVETFFNRGHDATALNHFRAATLKLKARLAAYLAHKE